MIMAQSKEQILQEMGLSVNESKVYIAMLNIGASTAGKIAEKCKLHRTNVYDSLERLELKGLASYILKNDKKIFEAADPSTLTKLVDERKAKLERIMPQLLLDRQLGTKTSAQVFEGIKSFKLAIFNFLNYEKKICAFGLPKIVPDVVKNFINIFHNTRIEKKILMHHIYNENAKERITYLNKLNYTEARYLPEQFNTPVSTLVCGEEVLIINWEKPLTFIRIENKALAECYRKYFEVLYSAASSKI